MASRESVRLCEWCGRELPEDARSDKRACSSSCRAAKTRHAKGEATDGDYALRTAQAPPIEQIRRDLEDVKREWSLIVREAIRAVFREKGEFHADDLAPLGIPDEHRNIIGAQIAGLVGAGRIEEIGRRKSTIPSRHGAKSGVYKLTKLGQEKLAELRAGVSDAARPDGVVSPTLVGADAELGEATPAGESDDSLVSPAGEPARLFGSSAPVAGRPLSAFRDPEAA